MARETVSLKLEAEMKAELQERAREDVRTLGNLIEMVLTRYLEEQRELDRKEGREVNE